MNAPLLLEVARLATHFHSPAGPVRAVDGVDLSLRQGETLGVVGESGSGKTVLSRSIVNILPRNAIAHAGGHVRFRGEDLRSLSTRALRRFWGREITMVFQDPMTALNPVLEIGTQIAEPLRVHLGMSRRAARARAVDLLREVGVPAPELRLREYPHQLSGGMRQRVMIAIALSCGPALLIADEPTTALDVTVQKQILDLLATEQRRRQMGMILVTHDLGVVASRADRIAVMYAGRIVEQAPTRALFSQTRHPYTRALLASIPRLEFPSHTRLATIPGQPPSLVDPLPGCRFAGRCQFAQKRCLVEEPQRIAWPAGALAADGESVHEYACFYPVGTTAGDEALARNRERGHSASAVPVQGDAAMRPGVAGP